MKTLLIDAVTKRHEPMMFFVGAGISIDSGLPGFKYFGEHIIKSLTWLWQDKVKEPFRCILDEKDIQEFTTNLRPEVLLQTMHEAIGDEIFQFYDWLDSDNPNYYHCYLARAIKYGHFVFTSNIDCLIEKAYEKLYPNEQINIAVHDSEYVEFTHGYQWADVVKPECPGVLFKVHGTLDKSLALAPTDRYQSIRFLLNQVGRGVPPNTKEVMEECIRRYERVFIGYSGCDHFSNQPILQNTKTQKRTYWLWFDSNKSCDLPDNQFLDKEKKKLQAHIENGKTFASFEKGLELRSVERFFAEQKSSILHKGDVFELFNGVKEILEICFNLTTPLCFQEEKTKQAAPNPQYLDKLRMFDRLHVAARLFFQQRSLKSAEDFADLALKHCEKTKDEVIIHRLLANIFNAHNGSTYLSQSIVQLEEVITKCKCHMEHSHDKTDVEFACENIMNASVEITNCLRRKKVKRQEIDSAVKEARRTFNTYRDNVNTETSDELLIKLCIYEGYLLTESEDTWAEGIDKMIVAKNQCNNIRLQVSAKNFIGLAYLMQAKRDKNDIGRRHLIDISRKYTIVH
jgi:hypothetical protein